MSDHPEVPWAATDPYLEAPAAESVEFPPVLPADQDDPLGLAYASQIANGVAGTMPVSGRVPKKPHRRVEAVEQRTAAGPDARDPKLLGEALGSVVRDQQWTTELGVRQLLMGWRMLVGASIAEHSEPIGFDDGVVVVQAASTAWATALRQLAPQVVAKLNEQLGDGTVRRIEVRGPAAPSWKHGPRSVRDGRGPRDTYG